MPLRFPQPVPVLSIPRPGCKAPQERWVAVSDDQELGQSIEVTKPLLAQILGGVETPDLGRHGIGEPILIDDGQLTAKQGGRVLATPREALTESLPTHTGGTDQAEPGDRVWFHAAWGSGSRPGRANASTAS